MDHGLYLILLWTFGILDSAKTDTKYQFGIRNFEEDKSCRACIAIYSAWKY